MFELFVAAGYHETLGINSMTGILLFYLVIPTGLFVLLWLFRVRSKKFLFGIPVFVLCLPIVFGVGLYVLRTPIQQGEFLPELGPLLSLVFPADDLYETLVEETVSTKKNTYSFNLSHKYVGNHAVFIEVPSNPRSKLIVETGLKLNVIVTKGDKELFAARADRGSPFLGKGRYGFYYVGYKVPKDIPVSTGVKLEVQVAGDVAQFLKNHGMAKVVVRKRSDQ